MHLPHCALGDLYRRMESCFVEISDRKVPEEATKRAHLARLLRGREQQCASTAQFTHHIRQTSERSSSKQYMGGGTLVSECPHHRGVSADKKGQASPRH